ncbi:MAG TPA: o-succinylbenzoate synthase [Mycobacteriales bacterium]|jgi:O-succinylbenzoate synthase|nr:o-succinylbenzoate synthase [Mycobacteriales bacterium]
MSELLVFDLPMRVRFRRQTRRSGVLVHGATGWGEFSPFPDYEAATCGRWLAAAREAAHDGWPRAVRDRVPVNTTVPAVSPQQAHALVRASGCTTAKVKVAEPGQTLADDVARVEAVRDALGPSGKVRVDANAAWSVDEAVAALKALDVFDLEYAEQPVAGLDEMAELRRRVDVRLAADESVRTADDPLRIAGLEAADVVVLKVQPLGGVRRCLEVAEACGLPVVVSSAVETSVGIAAGVALAAALPELPFACGLGTVSLLDGDVTADPLLPVDGHLPVRRVEPDPALVHADEETTTWWLDRMRAAADG